MWGCMPSVIGKTSPEGVEFLEEMVDKEKGVEQVSEAVEKCIEYTAHNKYKKDLSE